MIFMLLRLKYLGTFLFLIFGNIIVAQDDDWMQEYDFVFLRDHLTQAIYDIRYASDNNFVGRPIDGYETAKLVMTQEAAEALMQVEQQLKKSGYGLKIFDTYRPQRAVNQFKAWATIPQDTLTKKDFYPHQDKSKLFQLGYISSRSGHSRGSTIDLTLYHLESKKEVDMGAPYDFFGEISHHDYQHLSNRQIENRKLLKRIMYRYGFIAYSKEWWHYTLHNEPYPNKYFDFIVP